ncbi:hypothetical protein M1N86_00200 [Dehalococcoidia bacterium]|nr:hypothetical protein [Dehalococcoidia bacterium]
MTLHQSQEYGYEVIQLALAEAAAKALGEPAQRLGQAYNECGHGSPPDSRYTVIHEAGHALKSYLQSAKIVYYQ